MKKFFAIAGLFFCASSINAQLIRSTDGRNDISEEALPAPSALGDVYPVAKLYGLQVVQIGHLLGGQTIENLEIISSLTITPSIGGPLFRKEYISVNPYIHGPSLIDFANPISMVFTNPVEEVGIDVIHHFGALTATFPAGGVEILAFDTLGKLIGKIFSTATTGSYTDPLTWDFIAFETADQTASIKALTIYSTDGEFGIGPSVRFEGAGGLLPVPEPSAYGLAGAALLGMVLALRKRSISPAFPSTKMESLTSALSEIGDCKDLLGTEDRGVFDRLIRRCGGPSFVRRASAFPNRVLRADS